MKSFYIFLVYLSLDIRVQKSQVLISDLPRSSLLSWWLTVGTHLLMQEESVQSPGREGPVEEGMAAHSSALAWEIPWMEEPGRLQSTGSTESDMTEQRNNKGCYTYFLFVCLFVSQERQECSRCLCMLQKTVLKISIILEWKHSSDTMRSGRVWSRLESDTSRLLRKIQMTPACEF